MSIGEGSNFDLTFEDIIDLKSKNEIILVDVRDLNEIQENGELPGCIHIPLAEVSTALQLPPEEFKKKYDGAEQPLKSAPIVFTCRSGNRSRRALNAALELGFAKSRHYIGGYNDWKAKTQ